MVFLVVMGFLLVFGGVLGWRIGIRTERSGAMLTAVVVLLAVLALSLWPTRNQASGISLAELTSYQNISAYVFSIALIVVSMLLGSYLRSKVKPDRLDAQEPAEEGGTMDG